jgi:hypothetical protein
MPARWSPGPRRPDPLGEQALSKRGLWSMGGGPPALTSPCWGLSLKVAQVLSVSPVRRAVTRFVGALKADAPTWRLKMASSLWLEGRLQPAPAATASTTPAANRYCAKW